MCARKKESNQRTKNSDKKIYDRKRERDEEDHRQKLCVTVAMKSEEEDEEEDGKRATTGARDDDDRALARLAPSGAFGVPSTPPRTKNEETRYGASWGRSIVFLDDALCAVPVEHGVLLVESERGRQVAFVPGTPGQRRVTAIAAKKCFNERNNGGDDFDEERERGINGQRRRDAGSSLSLIHI